MRGEQSESRFTNIACGLHHYQFYTHSGLLSQWYNRKIYVSHLCGDRGMKASPLANTTIKKSQGNTVRLGWPNEPWGILILQLLSNTVRSWSELSPGGFPFQILLLNYNWASEIVLQSLIKLVQQFNGKTMWNMVYKSTVNGINWSAAFTWSKMNGYWEMEYFHSMLPV